MKIKIILYIFSMLSLLSSCGIIELDTEEGVVAVEMKLNYHDITVMKGDTIPLQPIYKPDTISIQDVFWMLDADSIIVRRNDKLVAREVGQAFISAISVSQRIADTCRVHVMERWEVEPYAYPNDMIVYAEAKINGKPMTDDMILGAFITGECRGIAEKVKLPGNSEILRIRIYGDLLYDNDNAHDDEDDIANVVTFRCYDPVNLKHYFLTKRLVFDGMTHGMPSRPIMIE